MQSLDFELSGDPTQAPQMAKYMKHQFPFFRTQNTGTQGTDETVA